MSQFKFLVMTDKNIFVYKLLLSLHISDFNLIFYVKTAIVLKKSHLALSQQRALIIEILPNPHL